tara:strand:+ start:863 stop:1291 length:429 start_codon:yes stop_codon:yes gene_type:complete
MSNYRNEPTDTLVDPVYEQDAKRYKGQKNKILSELIYRKNARNYNVHNPDGYVSKTELQWASGSQRIASRIDELRDDYVIDTKYNFKSKEAYYCLRGKRVKPRIKRSHCKTCTCNSNVNKQPEWFSAYNDHNTDHNTFGGGL